uniref:TIMELESS-interacting protein n=1 Tax=Aceria tosichella TaxID=561515 RepID=A0A6G1S5R1_9ACAR
MDGVWAEEFDDDSFLDYYGEAIEVPEPTKKGEAILIDPLSEDPDAKPPPKPKKIVQNPRPKLDVDRLLNEENGLPQLVRSAYDLMYKPDNEIENLRRTLSVVERWSHRLFPKYTFKDFLDKCETTLGKKRPVKTHLRKVRTGLIPS